MGNIIGGRQGTMGEVNRFTLGYGSMAESGQPGLLNPVQFNPLQSRDSEVALYAMSDVADLAALQDQVLKVSTRRLLLRPLAPEDFAALTEVLAANAAPLEASGFGLGGEIGVNRDAYLRVLAGLAFLRAIDQRADFGAFAGEELVGMVGLESIQRGQIETGSVMVWTAQSRAGEGFATEAVAGVLRLAFEDLSLHRVEALMLPDNAAALRLTAKLGFQDEGIARRSANVAHVWRDHRRAALVVEDWNERRNQYADDYGV